MMSSVDRSPYPGFTVSANSAIFRLMMVQGCIATWRSLQTIEDHRTKSDARKFFEAQVCHATLPV